jgi:hypothetical protein
VLGAAALLAGAGTAFAQQRTAWVDPHADVVGDEIVQNGYRRVYRTEVDQVTPEQLAELIAEGKEFELDPATGGIIRHTFTDYLPQGWLMEPPADGSRVDSYGNPIVNDVQGLPAWSQRNVDALRARIAEWRDTHAAAVAAGADTRETASNLGNYLGQAVARDINVDAIVMLEGVDNAVAASVIDYLRYYESERVNKQEIFHYTYTPTAYSPRIAAFVASHGTTLQAVQHVDPAQAFGDRGASCYSTSTFARGMTTLAVFTDIWNASGADDTFTDVSTGFGQFFYYSCSDADNNDMVRVSTNGFQTFFQQGGGALDGTDLSNMPIPDATAGEPDGYIGPWWDDLLVATAQGVPDRVSYATEGAVGSRVFTVQYFSMSRFGGTTSEWYYFQTKLYEVSDVIEMHYGTAGGFWTNGGGTEESATIGTEDYDGSSGLCGPNCTNTNTDAPASNYRFEYFRPFNDECTGAATVIDGSVVNDTLHRASNSPGTGCTTDYNRDRWYRFVAPCAGDLNVSMCGSFNGGGVDTVISVHSACPASSANSLACNDQFGGTGCSANDSQVTVSLANNQEVFIRVSNFSTTPNWFQNGSFVLTTNFTSTGAAPANDSSATPIILTDSAAGVQDLGCATNDGSTTCVASNRDLWYRFNAPCDGTLSIDTNTSQATYGIDTTLSAHSAVPGTAANTVACDDDGGTGLDSLMSFPMTAGQSVWVRASHFSNFSLSDGRFFINFVWTNGAAVPANDTCANAIALSCNQTVLGYNCGATLDTGDVSDSCGTGALNAGVWYTVVGNGAEFGATTCHPATTFNTKMSVYTGTCGALTCVTGNDDSVCGVNPLASRVTWVSTPGTRYYIFVQGFAGATGNFGLTIVNNGLPANDNCASAQNVTSGTYLGNLWCATNDGTATCGASATNRDVWYRFVAPADGTLTADGCGSRNGGGVDMVLTAFAGSCAGPQVLCNDDFGGPGCNFLDSVISGPMTGGQVVLLRVSHFGGGDPSFRMGNGTYVLNINFSGCDSVDWNGDGLFPDFQDVLDFLSVYSGGFCAAPNPPVCNTDIDFNNDGLFPDSDDIATIIRVFAGGSCF